MGQSQLKFIKIQYTKIFFAAKPHLMSYITSKVKINANALIGIKNLNIAPVTNVSSYFGFGRVISLRLG